jgi:hypothetical protein
MTPAQVGAQVAGAGPALELVALIAGNDFAGTMRLNEAIAAEMPFSQLVERWFVGRITRQWPLAEAKEPWKLERAKQPEAEEWCRQGELEWAKGELADRAALAGKDRLADLGRRLANVKPKLPEPKPEASARVAAEPKAEPQGLLDRPFKSAKSAELALPGVAGDSRLLPANRDAAQPSPLLGCRLDGPDGAGLRERDWSVRPEGLCPTANGDGPCTNLGRQTMGHRRSEGVHR